VTLRAPRAGKVLTVHVSPGQYVPAAAPLVTLIDLEQPWVRVPVPEYDLPAVKREQSAPIVLKSPGTTTAPGPKGRNVLSGKWKALVPQVDPTRHTAEVIYELAPGPLTGLLAKDQLVTVFVPLGKKRPECVVPYDAVVFDAHGGSWVYLDKSAEGADPHLYERQRVELGPTLTDGIVLWRADTGPTPADGIVLRPALHNGERVVVTGAAELFSREFYKPPVPGAP
jgi:multidrug efflux pump subunit AcrA (membrane-fusion protein)